jgi:hypothetical protein
VFNSIVVAVDLASNVHRVVPWAPFAGVVYVHLLVERIEAAGWLSDVEGALTDRNRGRKP